jgi:hypothetical protein
MDEEYYSKSNSKNNLIEEKIRLKPFQTMKVEMEIDLNELNLVNNFEQHSMLLLLLLLND